MPCTWGDTKSVEIIFMVPSGQSAYNFSVEAGVINIGTSNGVLLKCTDSGAYVLSINGTTVYTSPTTGFRLDKWMIMTITNTGSGNCIVEFKNLTDATTESYTYTGGAISSSILVSPWCGIRNTDIDFPNTDRWCLVDYMSIRYQSNRT
jgi:hypothetical protein